MSRMMKHERLHHIIEREKKERERRPVTAQVSDDVARIGEGCYKREHHESDDVIQIEEGDE